MILTLFNPDRISPKISSNFRIIITEVVVMQAGFIIEILARISEVI